MLAREKGTSAVVHRGCSVGVPSLPVPAQRSARASMGEWTQFHRDPRKVSAPTPHLHLPPRSVQGHGGSRARGGGGEGGREA
jgi:hypothetical protein